MYNIFFLRTPTNFFVVNLAFSDFVMMSTMGLPVTVNAFVQVKIKINYYGLHKTEEYNNYYY